MRVTQKMSINNAIYWMSKNSQALYRKETEVASGKKVLKPSDDPQAAAQILSDRNTISQLGQYQSNIDQAKTWVETGVSVLETANKLLKDAKNIILDQSSGDLDTREEAVEQLKSITEQIIALANEKYGEGYMYSGSQTFTKPFENEACIVGGVAENIEFDLAGSATSVTVAIFDQNGNAVRNINQPAGVEGTNSISWDGLDDFGAQLPDGQYSYTITATDAAGDDVASFPSYRGGEQCKCVSISDEQVIAINNNGGNIFSEALKSLSNSISIIENENNAAALSAEIDSLEKVIGSISGEVTALSNAYSNLEAAEERIKTKSLNVENRMTTLETIDQERGIVELQAQQTAYETTLQVASTILNQRKLMDLL